MPVSNRIPNLFQPLRREEEEQRSSFDFQPLPSPSPAPAPRAATELIGAPLFAEEERDLPALTEPISSLEDQDIEGSSNFLIDILLAFEVAFFDRSARGVVYAIANNEGFEGVIKRFLEGSPFAAIGEWITDIDLHKNITSEQLLKSFGVEEPGFFGSLLYDIAFSPSTYIGLGGLNHLGRAAKAGSLYRVKSGLDKVEDVFRVYRLNDELFIKAGKSNVAKAFSKRVAQDGKDASSWFGGIVDDSLEQVLLPPTSAARVEAGFRSVATFAGRNILPQAINVPLLNGVRRLYGRATRVVRGTRPGGALRDTFIVGPKIGEGTGFSTSALDELQDIEAIGVEATRQSAWNYQGVRNVISERLQRTFLDLYEHLPDNKRALLQHLAETGAGKIDDALDPVQLTEHFDNYVDEILGAGANVRMRSVVQPGDTIESFEDAARAEIQRIAQESFPGRSGHLAVRYVIENVSAVERKTADAYLEARPALLRAAGVADEATDTGFVLEDFIYGLVDEDELRVFEKLLTPEDLKQVSSWSRFVSGHSQRELDDIVQRLAPIADRSEAVQKSFLAASRGVASLESRISGLIKRNMQTLEAFKVEGNRLLKPGVIDKARRAAQTAAKVVAIGSHTLDVSFANKALAQKATVALGKIPKWIGELAHSGATEDDLALALLHVSDDLHRALLFEERAVGVTVEALENYVGHVKTKAAANIIDSTMDDVIRSGSADLDKLGLEFTRERKFTGWTTAEVNAFAQANGFAATDEKTLASWIREQMVTTRPNLLRELELVEPEAALFFQADLAQSLMARHSASVKAVSEAEFAAKWARSFEDGGLASRVWVPVRSKVEDVRKAMLDFTRDHPGYILMDSSDVFRLRQVSGREVFLQGDIKLGQTTADLYPAHIPVGPRDTPRRPIGRIPIADEGQRVYHGTAKSFTRFDPQKSGTNAAYYGEGIYVSSSPEVASRYADAAAATTHPLGIGGTGQQVKFSVIPSEANILDGDRVPPSVIDDLLRVAPYEDQKTIRGILDSIGVGDTIDLDYVRRQAPKVANKQQMETLQRVFYGRHAQRLLQRRGYDGIKIRSSIAGSQGDEWVIFNADLLNDPEKVIQARRAQETLVSETQLRTRELAQEMFAQDDAFRRAKGIKELRPAHDQIKAGKRYVAVHRELFREMNAVHKRMTDPILRGGVMRLVHKATDWFKLWWTVPFPNFHMRNYLSDVHMAGLDGMTSPHYLVQASRLQKATAGVMDNPLARGAQRVVGMVTDPKKSVLGLDDFTATTVKGEVLRGRDLMRAFKRRGLIDSNVGRADLALRSEMDILAASSGSTVRTRWDRTKAWLSGRRNRFLDTAGTVGTAGQNNVRIALALHHLEHGLPLDDAISRAKRALIDYTSQLFSQSERTFFRAGIPFYSFWRRNIPNQVEKIVQNRGVFKPTFWGKALEHFENSSEEKRQIGDLPDELVPDFVRDAYGVRVRVNDDGEAEYFLMKNWLPASDVAELGDVILDLTSGDPDRAADSAKRLAARITPFVKLPAELISNVSFFTGRDIRRYDGHEAEVFGMSIPAKTAYFLRQIRVVNEIDRFGLIDIPTLISGELERPARSGELGERGQVPLETQAASFLLGGRPYTGIPQEQYRRFDFESRKKVGKLMSERNRLLNNFRTRNRLGQLEDLEAEIAKIHERRFEVERALGIHQRRITGGQ